MRKALKFTTVLFVTLLLSCGGSDKKEESSSYGKKAPEKKEVKAPASQRIDLSNKGIGSITSVDLGLVVDQDMAAQGKEVFEKMCTACHKADKKFIGPSPKDILKRRSPEWVMNMILNPDEMVKRDPLAKDLLIEFNGSPMANQNLTKEEARAVLEYFRTLK
ncbi:cytochrome c, class I [Flavobacteriales bacterium ALC-1]|nr:cytochrome c, class I [Flavobacteriales bacterium ALC-1]